MRRSRGEVGSAQARKSASNNKKQEPGNMADLGKKYCVNCLADVTNLRLRCTDCPDIELCPECFSAGAEIGNHRRWHGYQQVDGGRFSLWGPEAEGGWTSREEQSLLDAIEQYGFGNWVRFKLLTCTTRPQKFFFRAGRKCQELKFASSYVLYNHFVLIPS